MARIRASVVVAVALAAVCVAGTGVAQMVSAPQASKQASKSTAFVDDVHLDDSAHTADGMVVLAGDAASDGSSAPDASLAWRDEDFAVDPSRQTEWRTTTDGSKTIWLTFDDGPSANTQKVLDVLNRYGVKATFFVTAEDESYAPMIKKAYDEGNTIGLHTYSHKYSSVYASESAYFDDLQDIGSLVKSQIGYVPCFVRFPGGSSNTVSAKYAKGIMSTLVRDVQSRGYQYFDWNVSCGDGDSGYTPQELADNAISGGEGYTNIVLLMHDSAAKDASVAALPAIIEHYQQAGYQFKALDRDSLACHHGVNN